MDGESPLHDLRRFELHPLSGDRKGQWAVTATGNWRITFRWTDGIVTDVNIDHYH